MSQRKTCKISGCNRPVWARGMCAMHYQRWWRNQPGNREKTRAYVREYAKRHPDEIRSANFKWYKKNLDKVKEYGRRYYAKKGARYFYEKYSKKWRKQHPQEWKEQKKRYYQKYAQNTPNSGKPYDDFDDAMILDKVILDNKGKITKRNVPDVELAQYLGRSLAAIQEHRHVLKKKLGKSRPKK